MSTGHARCQCAGDPLAPGQGFFFNLPPKQSFNPSATGSAVIEQLMECRLQQGAGTFRATGQMKVTINPTPALIN